VGAKMESTELREEVRRALEYAAFYALQSEPIERAIDYAMWEVSEEARNYLRARREIFEAEVIRLVLRVRSELEVELKKHADSLLSTLSALAAGYHLYRSLSSALTLHRSRLLEALDSIVRAVLSTLDKELPQSTERLLKS